MRSPEELDAIDWASLTHAYGVAEDVPELVRALYLGDPEEVGWAICDLFGKVLHQGSVYPATVDEDLRPRLRHWALSPRRLLATHWPPDTPHPDDGGRDSCLRLLSA